MSYLVTVIIPTYNAEKSIKTAVESIQNQTLGFENIELLIVDDNSKDNTKKILKEYSQKFDNIKCFYSKTNSGSAGKGRNIGIDNANSDYIMFLDQDDMYLSDMCEVLYSKIKHNQVNIVMCKHKTIINKEFDYKNATQKISSKKIKPKENREIFNNIFMWNKIFCREFLIKNNIKCPENYLSEDMVFCIKVYLNLDEMIYLDNYYGYLYNVRDSKEDSSTINSINKERYLKLLQGFYKTIEILKENKNNDLIICLMKNHLITLISLFIRLNENYNSKIIILEELYEFKKYINLDFKLNEKWAEFINKNIEERNFYRIIFISNIINQIYKLNFFRNIYRKVTNKIS